MVFDSVVWMQCAHGGSQTWNFDLLVSTPQCWLLQLPASYVTLRAQTALCCWMMMFTGIVTDSNLFLFVCNDYICICNCLCTCVCVLAYRSEWLPVTFLWGFPSWFLTQEFRTEPGACCFNKSPACPCHYLKLRWPWEAVVWVWRSQVLVIA